MRSGIKWDMIAGNLAAVMALPLPSWVRPETAALFVRALGALRGDAVDAMRHSLGLRVLAMSRAEYVRACAPGGWLVSHGRNATLAEVLGGEP
jgi:hypothetical protein